MTIRVVVTQPLDENHWQKLDVLLHLDPSVFVRLQRRLQHLDWLSAHTCPSHSDIANVQIQPQEESMLEAAPRSSSYYSFLPLDSGSSKAEVVADSLAADSEMAPRLPSKQLLLYPGTRLEVREAPTQAARSDSTSHLTVLVAVGFLSEAVEMRTGPS